MVALKRLRCWANKYILAGLSFLLVFPIGMSHLPQTKTPASSYPPGNWDRIIDGHVFTETLSLDTGDDNVLIINAVFHSIDDHAIMLRNVSNVYIKDCEIYDINGFGILLRGTGSTTNVTIEGCKIYNTKASGIMASQRSEDGVDHHNLVIRNNTIFDNGTNDHEHNIYVQATDSLIEGNTVYNSSGNGISIRSTGIVRNNVIWDSAKSCIRYFNDHAPGPSDTLIIEKNYCQLSDPGLDESPGISLLQSKSSPENWLAGNYYIRSNTVVLQTGERYGFEVESKAFDAKFVSVYDNIFVNTVDVKKTVAEGFIDYLSNNEETTSLSVLDNPSGNPDEPPPVLSDEPEPENQDITEDLVVDDTPLAWFNYFVAAFLVIVVSILLLQSRAKGKSDL